jgi:hypothetical protein
MSSKQSSNLTRLAESSVDELRFAAARLIARVHPRRLGVRVPHPERASLFSSPTTTIQI